VNTTPLVTATALSYEERPPSAGLIKGNLTFGTSYRETHRRPAPKAPQP